MEPQLLKKLVGAQKFLYRFFSPKPAFNCAIKLFKGKFLDYGNVVNNKDHESRDGYCHGHFTANNVFYWFP